MAVSAGRSGSGSGSSRRRARSVPAPIPRALVPSIAPGPETPAEVLREFRALTDDGRRVHVPGLARKDPARLLRLGYVPRYKLSLFGRSFYLADARQNDDIRFFVAYLHVPPGGPDAGVHARLLYKDGSLLWRSASHWAFTDEQVWIGKGDVVYTTEHGRRYVESVEHTTDLPLEMQSAVESLLRRAPRFRDDRRAVALVLREASARRIGAFRDFTALRRRARRNPLNLVLGGRPIARFTRPGDPASLRFVRGFEPDFDPEPLEVSHSASRLYDGRVTRHRIVSKNRLVQYLFFSAPHHVWLGHPQATTTELSSYGVRTVDVTVPEDLVVPGMEYHYLETEDPPVWMSQIPEGYAGPVSPVDPWRADASAWLEAIPVVREFRRRVLRQPSRIAPRKARG